MCRFVTCLAMFCCAVANTAFAEAPIYFADANLKAVVEARLGIADPNAIDMLALGYLSEGSRAIRSLRGLEYATNMIGLVLINNQISDLLPLAGLTNLTYLRLDGNWISDLSPLGGLANLTELYLINNQISNFSPLAGLTNLTKLRLDGNWISDLSPLGGLAKLTELWLRDNQISNLSPLAGLTNLRYLHLDNNWISDLSPLDGLVNLTNLYLADNRVSDLSPLAALKRLGALGLDGNPLNAEAYTIYIPLLRANNPGIIIHHPAKRSLNISSTTGGHVSTPGEGVFEYYPGQSVSIAATPHSEYEFIAWTGTAVTAGRVSQPTALTTYVRMDDDYTLVAHFSPISAPVAVIQYTPPVYPMAGGIIIFDGSSSMGTPVEYIWDFGDGTRHHGTAAKATHRYERPGVYKVTLVVKNALGEPSKPAVEVLDLDLRNGDLLIQRSLWSWVPGYWSHVGIYHKPTNSVIEARMSPNGVGLFPFSDWSYPAQTCVQAVRVMTNQSVADLAVAYALEEIGIQYDLVSILQGTRNVFNSDKRGWYCSELAWACYLKASDFTIDLDPYVYAVSPDAIAASSHVQLVGMHVEKVPDTHWTRWSFLWGRTRCPVDMEVTDPGGRVLSKFRNEIPGAYYQEGIVDTEGHKNAFFIVPQAMVGSYAISIHPDSTPRPTDTYSLEVCVDGRTRSVAQDVPIGNIPSAPYTVMIEDHIPTAMHTLTLSSSAGGELCQAASGLFGIPTSMPAGLYEYLSGTQVSLYAVPDTHHRFVCWTGTAVDAGKIDAASPGATFCIDADYTLTAHFEDRTTYVVRGFVQTARGLGIPEVAVFAHDGADATTTNSVGYFRLTVPVGWMGHIRTEKAGCSFTPAYMPLVHGVNSDQHVDFTAICDMQPVHFADANLKAAVEAALGKSDPNAADMLYLTTLRVWNTYIVDLIGLEYATNLERLDVHRGDLSDLGPLSGLRGLRILDLQSANINDVSALAGLTELRELVLLENQISDISPLANLRGLQQLCLDWNAIVDISPVSGLTGLQVLSLGGNQISDIRPLSGLSNLGGLYLFSNQIVDISPLTGLANLYHVMLIENPLNQAACDVHIPQIRSSSPRVLIDHDPCVSGMCSLTISTAGCVGTHNGVLVWPSGSMRDVVRINSGVYECPCGTVVEVQPNYLMSLWGPLPNCHFVRWTGTAVDAGKVADPTSAHTSVTVDGDYTLIMNFEPKYDTVATPTFSPDGGTHTGSVNVTISCATSGATIRYTTNGTDPTESSPVYTGPIAISSTTTLKARAWRTGWTPSDIGSVVFTVTRLTVTIGGSSSTLWPDREAPPSSNTYMRQTNLTFNLNFRAKLTAEVTPTSPAGGTWTALLVPDIINPGSATVQITVRGTNLNLAALPGGLESIQVAEVKLSAVPAP
jgi:Leucine-rich repeat (LRR) protein/uncharacterized protein YycO